MAEIPELKTGITDVTADDIVIRGHKLTDLVGKMSFTDAFFLQMRGRNPDKRESRMLEALMVNSMEHGINQAVLIARLTNGGAPEAIQASIAAGILGMGSVSDGAIELVGDLIYAVVAEADAAKCSDEQAAKTVVARYREQKKFIPGLGHPMHKGNDPRTGRLFGLAEEMGFEGRFVRIMHLISKFATELSGRELPINGAAAVATMYCELGFSAAMAKAITIVALCAGITGHLLEERKSPMARGIRRLVAKTVKYEPAKADG